MKAWIKTFFEEKPGWGSAMRFIYIIGHIWLMIFLPVIVFLKYATFSEAGEFFVKISAILNVLKGASKHIETRTV